MAQLPSRDLLLHNHSFPGEYIFKAFGPAGGAFETDVLECATSICPGRVQHTVRATKSGHKICVTVTAQANDVDEVLQVYARMMKVDQLMMIL